MSKTNSLHYKLCCEGAKWMRKQEWGTYRIVTVELCTLNVENPDVWGTTGFKSMLIEVKTSRTDFLNDKRKKFRTDDEEYRHYALGNKRYYLVPKGLVDIDELPPHWGLLEWDGTCIVKVKEAEEVVCENSGEVAMLCSIMRREGVRKEIFNYRKKNNKQNNIDMKREILFRGWNKKNKQWLYGYYFVYRGEHFIAPDEFVNPLASYEDYVVEADTIGQYTGLKDAKGVKIFEGDTIESNGCRHSILYNDKEAQFVAVDRYIQCGISQRWIDKYEKVIIGNVHENSELIKTE